MFCDWYLELLKPVFMGEDDDGREGREPGGHRPIVLDEIYKLLHPFMPFMTEELWAQTAGEDRAVRRCFAMHAGRTPDFEDQARPPRSTGWSNSCPASALCARK